ncbi:MMPL family transporter [Solirubrobacter sp. CPCC 204708]|uniref:Efflux RND transporter permease subunit n=1 Tax=Solirubrobacter deserti TaxID=2282478 RepID=A0ABT4RLD6_9ACTN|nr:efflux RND transporter permease subunit [Solirubrobacter deserti]MBE2320440.1 MMPL family transporter [Solirubrobacter deserti]MDA0139369.1 efflux RND transporter permease subunit [Solirubrobacter deserti]
MLERVGRAAARWRFAILAVWAALALVGGVIGAGVYDRTETVDDARGESARAAERLDELDPEGELVVAIIAGKDFFARDLIDRATAVMYELRETPGVVDVRDAYTAGGLQGDDGKSSLAVVELDPALEGDAALEAADRVAEKLRTIPAPEVLIGGKLLAERTFAEQATDDAVRGETIALVVLTIVLIIFLGGFVAGVLPLGAALATIAGSLLALNALAGVVAVSEFAVNVVTLLGLGLAVDYSLLVIARFREQRTADPDAPVEELLGRTVGAAGRAVLVSGLAVGIALIALYVFSDPVLSAMALGGVLAVATATLVGLTLVPALVAVAHTRIPARGRMPSVGLLARLAAFALRRPAAVAVVVAAGLIALSVPAFGLEAANADATSLPESAQERRVQEKLERDFSKGAVEPITVLSDRPPSDELPQRLVRLSNVEEVLPLDELPPEVSGYTVDPLGSDDGERAQQLVRDIRALDDSLLVGGPAAELLDAKDATRQRLPLALAVVFLPTALLLFALTRSVLVPLKAIVMNVLTLLATLGALVLLFPGPLDLTTPLLLFMFIFGLSMDYEVFLLARIKEEWDRSGDNEEAVLHGITASGPVVTLAALSIGIVFAGFALGELSEVREIGVGMALAVLLDVTLVRGLLLPAAMALLGRHNWWPGAVKRETRQMV